jgi:hypothetical protein
LAPALIAAFILYFEMLEKAGKSFKEGAFVGDGVGIGVSRGFLGGEGGHVCFGEPLGGLVWFEKGRERGWGLHR